MSKNENEGQTDMRQIIPIQSVNDIITNSSSEVIVLDIKKLEQADVDALIGHKSEANLFSFADDYVRENPINFIEFDRYMFGDNASYMPLSWTDNSDDELSNLEKYLGQHNMSFDEMLQKLSHLLIVDMETELNDSLDATRDGRQINEFDLSARELADNADNKNICLHSFCWD